jgi:hypothetical protein
MEQRNSISGSIYDVYDEDHQDFRSGRMPRIGQRVTFEDGREYVFASSDVDIGIGKIVRGQASSLRLVAKAAGVGEYEIIVTATSVVANAFAEGHFIVTSSSSGQGMSYKIKSNTATATIGGIPNAVRVVLYNALDYDLSVSDEIDLWPPRTKLVLLGTLTGDSIGITVKGITAGTTGKTQYFWVQTDGRAYINDSLTTGSALVASANGTFIDAIGADNPQVATNVVGQNGGGIGVLYFPH